jgi:tRNA guanosine-2'-O-methyltransferase
MVIANPSVLADKEFQNLSVTAQNWVDILEVRIEELPDFLAAKKNEGYR